MSDGAKKTGRRKRRKMSDTRLENIAVWYCQRYLVSSGKLTSHLTRRLYREVEDSEERQQFEAKLPALVEKLARAGLVNDAEAASSKLRSSLRAGYAPSTAAGLAARTTQVDRSIVEEALGEAMIDSVPDAVIDDEGQEYDAPALVISALRRARRGPWRGERRTEATDRRDFDWLRRRGYRYDDIKRALALDEDGFFDD